MLRPSWSPEPETEAEKLNDQWWRLCNLYRVMDEAGKNLRFVPRRVQAQYYWQMWFCNIILKSRQHGFTTFLALCALDNCIFTNNYHAHLIAHTREDAERLFEEKIRWPLRQLVAEYPEFGEFVEATEDSSRVLRFSNGSTISCGQSMRSGTLQWLHISEHGKICARFPDKAKEIRTGSLNTVHAGQYVVIESTAEGRQGDFYEYAEAARKQSESNARLSKLDFKFFFFPWWRDPKNALDPRDVLITDEQIRYFDTLRKANGISLTPGQKAWYAVKERQQRDLMLREHPSTSSEAFQGSMEGSYYGKLMIQARRQGRIVPSLPFEVAIPVDTSWDLGKNDFMAIWFHQWIAHLGLHRWIKYYANTGHGLSHYVNYLRDLRDEFGFTYGTHYLPHDVEVSELSMAKGKTRKDYLESLGLRGIVVVERVPNLADGIEAVRRILPVSQFSEAGCSEGLLALENYRHDWDEKTESFRDTPVHDDASNGADAFRQLCQEWEMPTAYRNRKTRPRNWKTA